MDRMDSKPIDNKPMSHAKGKASEMMNKLSDKLPENFDQQFETVKRNAQVALDRTESLVRQYPLYSILGAAAVGAIVGSFLGSRGGEKVYEQ